MEPAQERRTLVVANRTAATPLLLEEIKRRAGEEPTTFVLLCPARKGSDWSLGEALKALRQAARGPSGHKTPHVEGIEGGPDPFESVKAALADGDFDDVIISTLPRKTSEWLRRDLPRKVQTLNVPVTVITQPSGKRLPSEEAMLWNAGAKPERHTREPE